MANLIKTKRGLNIPVNGRPIEIIGTSTLPKEFALIPDNYHGITPKLLVKEGDEVKAGTPVFYEKQFPGMNFVSPVSGKIKAVNRGERRKIMSIIIESDEKMTYQEFDKPDLTRLTPAEIINLLQQVGLWVCIKQRPYDVIANPTTTPKAIFISTFDTAPLAPNNDFVMSGQMADFQTGIDALAKIATVQLGVRYGKKAPFSTVKNAVITEYDGPHPVGNVGIQINHVSPVNKGEIVWTANPQDVLFIGRFFNKGIVDFSRLIALTGPCVKSPQYYHTIVGANIENLVQGKIKSCVSHRFISGNVLTGIKVAGNGFLDPYATQITVLEEGNNTHELLGWGMPRFRKFSVSRTYFTALFETKLLRKLFGNMKYKWDTRLMGGKRAIIMSGEYDKVLPMDIYPEFLFKAMIAGNIDKMEALGAYEIAPEDVALCEFVCTSKLPLQQIVRNSLDIMKKELE
ncbi:MAG: Na(+)-translocating NADH-quinone reductase subunit A [Paludibacter sp.]|nr:Na(+)-translocating NADH-quinone reductase subunit A [Paludibacter sp.]MDD4198645.1 Na(+)-translocating NADH-quinone reductase subunit A [Paludibacter sp.]MDD4428365.1 Na(+)-translocating NADH-quinone reductase subunit A [Paludibacter sp.]